MSATLLSLKPAATHRPPGHRIRTGRLVAGRRSSDKVHRSSVIRHLFGLTKASPECEFGRVPPPPGYPEPGKSCAIIRLNGLHSVGNYRPGARSLARPIWPGRAARARPARRLAAGQIRVQPLVSLLKLVQYLLEIGRADRLLVLRNGLRCGQLLEDLLGVRGIGDEQAGGRRR